MSTHYETLASAELYRDAFGTEPPAALGERHLWPRKPGFFIVHASSADALAGKAPEAVPDAAATAPEVAAEVALDAAPVADATDAAAAPSSSPAQRLLVPAQWGLVPHWVKSASDAKLRAPKLVNAKADLASTSAAFREAWLRGQRCIVPMAAFFEDDHRNAKPVPTRIVRVDGKPMGVAGLWARWQGADGEVILSYCLLTVNANNHALVNRYGPPGSEKNMPVILNEGAYDAWLSARPDKAKEFMRQFAAQSLTANPVEKKADKIPKGWLD